MVIRRLTHANFRDYESLTACGADGEPCFCAFWYMNSGIQGYADLKRQDPLQLREIVRQRVVSGFHVGAIAYDRDVAVAWISVGPLPEIFWAWRRAAALGEDVARTTAAILCVTLAPDRRGGGLQHEVVTSLRSYGREQGWTALEAYPFSEAAVRAHATTLAWPGYEAPYAAAGFERIGPHWLSKPPEYERWIYSAPCWR
jgi:hypothetical protein